MFFVHFSTELFFEILIYKSSLHNMEISLFLGIKNYLKMDLSFLPKDFLASYLRIGKFQLILLGFLYIKSYHQQVILLGWIVSDAFLPKMPT